MAGRRKTPEEKIAALQEQERQIKAQLKREKAKVAQAQRKADTRRKIIAGALALEHKDEAFQATLHRLLNDYVKRPDERALFDLAPLDEAPATPTPEAASEAPPVPLATEPARNAGPVSRHFTRNR